MSSENQLLHDCEQLIREGRSREAADLLLRVTSPSTMPRANRQPYASLCRRVGLINQGFKTLARIVRPQRMVESEASAEELAEYAALLQRAGAPQEALFILKGLDRAKVPNSALFEAFCHFNRWDYHKAEPCLREYLSYSLPAYEKLVGQVNLASALLVNGKADECTDLLNQIIAQAKTIKATRLITNCLEVRAQAALFKCRFDQARLDLDEAAMLAKAERTQDLTFVQKWQAVAEILEYGNTGPLERFRKQAAERRVWENVREADLYLLWAEFDRDKFRFLYFGSPYEGYRKRIIRLVGLQSLPADFRFGAAEGPCLNLLTGEYEAGSSHLKPGKKIHQVLRLLCSDFYRPWSAAAVFADLYPGEFFDIYSTPNRINQIMNRTRHYLREQNIPVAIEQRAGCFSVIFKGDFAFKVPLQVYTPRAEEVYFQKALADFEKDGAFTSREGREALGLSASTYKRFLGWAIENGLLERVGSTHQTQYRFIKGKDAA